MKLNKIIPIISIIQGRSKSTKKYGRKYIKYTQFELDIFKEKNLCGILQRTKSNTSVVFIIVPKVY